MFPWQLPAVAVTIITWLTGPAMSLGDLARREAIRREMVPKAAHKLVTDDLPPGMPGPVFVPASTTSGDEKPEMAAVAGAPQAAAGQAAQSAGQAGDADKHDEAWWRGRMNDARQQLDRDRMLAEAMQGRINSLTTDFVNRDDPAQKAVVEQNRQKALAELERLEKQIVADQKAIEDIQKDAHRQGVPPGWIR